MNRIVVFSALLATFFGVAGCEAEPGGEETLVEAAPGVDPAVLEQTEFTVEPLIGEFKAESGQVLTVADDGDATLRATEDEASDKVFIGKWERSFDGVRVAITKIGEESREAEIYLRVKGESYEMKAKNLLDDFDLPASYSRAEKP
jgi:hypothetical protein